jgi:sterol 24-C-methyltransferase
VEFYRVLKPEGMIALNEYDHKVLPRDIQDSFCEISKRAPMMAFEMFEQGVLEDMLKEVGFEHVAVRDLTKNVAPMLRFFFILA